MFGSPDRVERADVFADVVPCLKRVQEAVNSGLFAVGCVSYEAAPAFDPALPSIKGGSSFPLLWFGLFRPGESCEATWATAAAASTACPTVETRRAALPVAPPLEWRQNLSRERYDGSISDIRRCIEDGWTYQVNFALRLYAQLPSPVRASPPAPGPSVRLTEYFDSVLKAQACSYGAFIDSWWRASRLTRRLQSFFFRWDARARGV